MSELDIYDEGYAAAKAGRPEGDCPYPHPNDVAAWRMGWLRGARKGPEIKPAPEVRRTHSA